MPKSTKNLATRDVERQPTGIDPFDEILGGGIPVGSLVLLSGSAGTGKTILSQQWLFAGYSAFDEAGIYIGLTEPTQKILRNTACFSYYDERAIGASPGVTITDLWSALEDLHPEQKHSLAVEDIERVLTEIRKLVEEKQAKRVVIDSVTALLYRLGSRDLARFFLFRLQEELAPYDTVVLLVNEDTGEGTDTSGLQEFIADGIIYCEQMLGEQAMVRDFQIVKMRGTDFRTGPVNFEITDRGIVIYPKIPINRSVAEIDFSKRRGTGVQGLNDLLGGGYPQGHIILIDGNSGTGKTTLGLQFIADGVQQGERALFVALEESETQVKHTAAAHGWDLEGWEFNEKVNFLNPSLLDLYPDKLLYEILRAFRDFGAQRVFLDSISTLESAAMSKDDVREFMIQLSSLLKTEGITALMTYLASDTFQAAQGNLLGGTKGSSLRMSSITDGIILLRYIERERSVGKLMHVLKMRGIDHDRGIHDYRLTRDGIVVGEAEDPTAITRE